MRREGGVEARKLSKPNIVEHDGKTKELNRVEADKLKRNTAQLPQLFFFIEQLTAALLLYFLMFGGYDNARLNRTLLDAY